MTTFRYYVDQLAQMEPPKREELERRAVARTEKWIEVCDVPPARPDPDPLRVAVRSSGEGRAAADGDKAPARSEGLGDTIKKITDATGLTKLAKVYERVTGKPCGCGERQSQLNEMFPYRSAQER